MILSFIGPWIEDAKIYSNSFFFQLLYSHTRRECNSVAHNVAGYKIDIPEFFFFFLMDRECSITCYGCFID